MPVVRPIPITLDKPRSLLFDHAAIFAVEPELTRVWGREYTFFQAIRQLGECLQPDAAGFMNVGSISLNNLSILLWKGCQHEDPTLTLAQVQQALPVFAPVELLPYVYAVLEAWQAQNPPPPVVDVQEGTTSDNPLDGSIGSPAGPTLVSTSA